MKEKKSFQEYKNDCIEMVLDVMDTEDLQEDSWFYESWVVIQNATNLHELTDELMYTEFQDQETQDWAFNNVEFQ